MLMSVESLLIKLTPLSGMTYAFFIGILLFISLTLFIVKDGVKKHWHLIKTQYKIILLTALLTALANIFFINAVKHTTIANTVIIISSAPLFATLFAYWFYQLTPHKNIYIASFFIFLGLFIIFSQELSIDNLFGDSLALLCTLSFSLTFVILSRHRATDIIAVLLVAAVILSLFSSLFVDRFTVDDQSIYILLIAGLFVTPFSRVFVLIGTKTLPASEVSLLTILETILAPIWAWIFLREFPHTHAIIGGSIILAALVINSLYLLLTQKEVH